MKKSLILVASVFATALVQASIVDFDSLSTGANGYYMASTHGMNTWGDSGAEFRINYNTNYFSWDGMTYSQVNDPNTGGYGNQYAVYGGGTDKSGSGNYAVGYYSTYSGPNTTISLGGASEVTGFYAHNTAYAADAILVDGFFESAFTTDDWFKLTVEGFDSSLNSQGSVDFMLADFAGYTEGDAGKDYLVSDWSYVDLSGLGSNVSSLSFSVSSSNPYTPSYFAMDELSYAAVPEPGTVSLMIAGLGGMVFYRRRRKYLMK